jgi:diguanylate cyclase (GGDEF)-like protein
LHTAPPASVEGPHRAPEELAKAWLLQVIDRTPLTEVGEVELDLLTSEASPLIAEILSGVASTSPSEAELPASWQRRAREPSRMRRGESAPAEIPRDLAALQSVLIESLRRDIPEREAGDFARSVGRLAEIFGAIQGAVTDSIARQRAGDPRRDELTQLPGSAELHEWLQILLAEYRRYGHPFTVALVDIEGLVHINDAYGREAGDRIVAAVGTVIRNQIRTVDRAFRLSDDEFSVLAPHERAERARSMAERLTRVIETSQAADGPRIAITVGVSSCPDNGDEVRGLLAAAEQATYAAKAAGQPVAVASSNGATARVQDH